MRRAQSEALREDLEQALTASACWIIVVSGSSTCAAPRRSAQEAVSRPITPAPKVATVSPGETVTNSVAW